MMTQAGKQAAGEEEEVLPKSRFGKQMKSNKRQNERLN